MPDDAIPGLAITPGDDALTIVASGYTLAFDRFDPAGDQAMVAPRMLGPEVRRCFEEGWGFITALGVHRDRTGTALSRALAIAKGIGGLRQGAIEMSPRQEAVLDLAVEQVLSPVLAHVNNSFVRLMLEQDIPLEAIITELMLSGEVERSYTLVRQLGFVGQLGFHSPTSQYGQLSRRGAYDSFDLHARMAELLDDITSGRFADEWDARARRRPPRPGAAVGAVRQRRDRRVRARPAPSPRRGRHPHRTGTGRARRLTTVTRPLQAGERESGSKMPRGRERAEAVAVLARLGDW